MSEKTAIGYARELVASLWHSFPEDAEQPIAAAIAAAEERGRRRGLEERTRMRRALLKIRAGTEKSGFDWGEVARIADAALAPRDSGKEMP